MTRKTGLGNITPLGTLRPRVSLVADEDPSRAISKALALLGEGVLEKAAVARKVVVKPDLVSAGHDLSATGVDAARAVFEYILPTVKGKVVLAGGAVVGRTGDAFERFGYAAMCEEYGVELRDLNSDETEVFAVFDNGFKRFNIKLAKTLLESDFRVWVGAPKTDDAAAVSLSVKDMAMAAPVNRAGPVARWLNRYCGLSWRDDKWAVYRSAAATHLNIFLLAKVTLPDLAVMDGHMAMEGDGPIYGTPVPWGIAMASEDPVALDFTCARMMGVKPERVGYLYYSARAGLGNGDPEVVGGNPAEYSREFKLHETADAHFWWDVPEERLAALGLAGENDERSLL